MEKVAKSVPSIQQFFNEFDAYEGRVFNIWELEKIFGNTVAKKAFEEMAEANQDVEPLRNNKISY